MNATSYRLAEADPRAEDYLLTEYTTWWKRAKAEKKAATVREALLPGEDVWFLGVCHNLRPFIRAGRSQAREAAVLEVLDRITRRRT